jgi:rubrerythrin
MASTESIDKLLDFAISEEQAAADFYTEMAATMTSEWTQKIFQGFAKEEQGHKAKLERIKLGKGNFSSLAEVPDLKIGDYLVQGELRADMDYQDALILAMKKEKSAYRLYSDLAQVTDNPEFKNALLSLAQEEAKHKLRFELEYDEEILKEN